ncbi:hypothetical protein WA026_009387 [Henosepilachna vigintioctopunctata]|uniref:sn-1-specific diacylglycerol lipase ABHD11 n=1 Tax=Henosepilachna vigintioctopunctata TaxID=420089 RepID=A0AAW1TY60_9CUCU
MTLLKTLNKFRSSSLKFSRYYIQRGNAIPDYVNLAYVTYESTSSETFANPLIIMHGLFGAKSNWNTLCKKYYEKTKPPRKIVAVDARNHGDSPHHNRHNYEMLVLDLKVLMENLEIDRACLLGHSMGGATAMLMALNHPTLVGKLIVEDISPISIKIGNLSPLIEAMMDVNLPRGVSLAEARAKADFQLIQNGVSKREMRRFLLTNLVTKSDEGFGWRLNLPTLYADYKNLENFPLKKGKVYGGPTMFVAGEESGAVKKQDIQKIKTFFPNSEFKFVKGAGHWVHNDKAEEFLNITLEFLNRSS